MPEWCKCTFFLFAIVSKDYPTSIRYKMCLKLQLCLKSSDSKIGLERERETEIK
jgi:hypothetical protein